MSTYTKNWCTHCRLEHTEMVCPQCGGVDPVQDVVRPAVSVPADSLDQLVQQASVPNLASLFRKAKQRGVIGAVSNYGESASA